MNENRCFNCNTHENDKPVLNMQFGGHQLWVCPQCLPNLIHHPDKIYDALAKSVKE